MYVSWFSSVFEHTINKPTINNKCEYEYEHKYEYKYKYEYEYEHEYK